MNQLTLTLMKVAFLAVLWLIVIAAAGVIRADLRGSKAAAKALRPRSAAQPARQPKAASPRSKRSEPSKRVITQGARAGTTLDLGGTEITMGRANDVTLPLGDDYCSGRHARLFSQNGQWFVEGLGSFFGFFFGCVLVC